MQLRLQQANLPVEDRSKRQAGDYTRRDYSREAELSAKIVQLGIQLNQINRQIGQVRRQQQR